MNIIKNLLLAILTLALYSCAASNSPQHSQTMSAKSGGVMMNFGNKSPFTIDMIVATSSQAPAPSYITATYVLPMSDVQLKPVNIDNVKPNQNVHIVSQTFNKMKNNSSVVVHLNLYKDKARTQLVDSMQQILKFNMPPKLIRVFAGAEKAIE